MGSRAARVPGANEVAEDAHFLPEIVGGVTQFVPEASHLAVKGADLLPDQRARVARGMLGPLGRQPIGQITVHSPRAETAQQGSYTTFIPSAQIADSRIGRGLGVVVHVEAVAVGTRVVWFCHGLRVVG